jgi:hypothetical protein
MRGKYMPLNQLREARISSRQPDNWDGNGANFAMENVHAAVSRER